MLGYEGVWFPVSQSAVQVGNGFFRVVIVHEGLLNVEVRGQAVLVQLHVRGDQLEGGEVEAADGAAVHEGAGVRLQVADHGGATAEEAQAHLALVGLLARVDPQVVGELARVGERFPTVPAPVPFGLLARRGEPVAAETLAEQPVSPRARETDSARTAPLPGRGRGVVQGVVGLALAVPGSPLQVASVLAQVELEGGGRVEDLRAQEAAQLLRAVALGVSASPRPWPVLPGVQRQVPLHQGALQEAAGTAGAGVDGQGEVREGVPEQGT